MYVGYVLYWHITIAHVDIDAKLSQDEILKFVGINILAVPYEWSGNRDNFLKKKRIRNLISFEFGKYFIEDYDIFLTLSESRISLIVNKNENKEATTTLNNNDGSLLLLQQRQDDFITDDDITKMINEGNSHLAPPRQYHPFSKLKPNSQTFSELLHESTLEIIIRPDVFEDLTVTSSDCLMCPQQEDGSLTHSNRLYIPRSLSSNAYSIYISVICDHIVTKSSAQYQKLLHGCAMYLVASYGHSYLLLDDSDTSNHHVDSPMWSNGINIDDTHQENGPLNKFDFYDHDLCNHQHWCVRTPEYQRCITKWQNPPASHFANCSSAKYLIYVVPTETEGGFSQYILNIGFMLRFAMCYDRILVLSYEKFNSNAGSMMTSLGSLTNCPLSAHIFQSATHAKNGLQVGLYPCKHAKYVWMDRIPNTGHCSSFRMHWTGSYDVLYGHHLGLGGDVLHVSGDGKVTDNTVNEIYDKSLEDFRGMNNLFSSIKLDWLSQMVRYIIKPHPLVSDLIKGIATEHLYSSPLSSSFFFSERRIGKIPKPFAVLLFHYDGMPSDDDFRIEKDIKRCLKVLTHKAPFIKNLFIPFESHHLFLKIKR